MTTIEANNTRFAALGDKNFPRGVDRRGHPWRNPDPRRTNVLETDLPQRRI